MVRSIFSLFKWDKAWLRIKTIFQSQARDVEEQVAERNNVCAKVLEFSDHLLNESPILSTLPQSVIPRISCTVSYSEWVLDAEQGRLVRRVVKKVR